MLNRHLSTIAAAAVGVSLAACTTLPVNTDANPSMSVSSCHTYAFANEHVANADQPAAYGNPLNAERLRVAIAANLAAKGIQPRRSRHRGLRRRLRHGHTPGVQRLLLPDGAGWGGWGRRGGFYGGWG